MVVGIVRFELHLPGAQSLKDKRQVVRSLKERLRERVHASVAEVEFQDLWQRAAIGLAGSVLLHVVAPAAMAASVRVGDAVAAALIVAVAALAGRALRFRFRPSNPDAPGS